MALRRAQARVVECRWKSEQQREIELLPVNLNEVFVDMLPVNLNEVFVDMLPVNLNEVFVDIVAELLPGIPNEVSVEMIAAKFLTWKEICVLSCVSRSWCQTVRSRELYRSRLRLQSTETLSLGCCVSTIDHPDWQTIGNVSLHSMRYASSYRLPQIPGFALMPLIGCLHVSLDGRIYVLGGQRKHRFCPLAKFSNEVFVLNVAGQKKWRQCASMKQARGSFGGAALDGKIYVFGGCQFTHAENGDTDGVEPFCESEVYDPEKNTWTSIKAIPSMRFGHHVTENGPALILHGGFSSGLQNSGRSGYEITNASSVEIYHPGEDNWTVVSLSEGFPAGLTMATGKTTSLGDPRIFRDRRGTDGNHIGPRPSLSL